MKFPAANDPGWRILRRIETDQKSAFWLAVILLILTAVTEGVSIAMLIPLVGLINQDSRTIEFSIDGFWDGALPADSIAFSLAFFLVLIFFIVSARAFLVHQSTLASARLTQNYVTNVRFRLFSAIARADWPYLSKLRNADVHHALTADIDRIQATVMVLIELIKSACVILIYLSLSVIISWRLTLVAAAIGAGLLIVLAPLRRRARLHGDRYTSARQAQSRIVSDFLDSIKLLKAFSAEDRFSARLRNSMTDLRNDVLSFANLSSRVNLTIQITSAFALTTIVYLALSVFQLSAAETLVTLVLYFRFAPKILQLQSHKQILNSSIKAVQNVVDLTEAAESAREWSQEAHQFSSTINSGIVLKEVSYQYENGKIALKNISAELSPNRITVLAGPTGCGKSTLADLLMGVITPTTGEILVDKTQIRKELAKSWRLRTGFVPQDPVLLHMSIRENLLLADPDAHDEAIWEALGWAKADDFVRSLPNGLDTIVGARGQLVSGGERQRLALARAILRRPALLVLDEATSALDWAHEEAIAESLSELKKKMTIVMVAHRERMIDAADIVLVLKGGRIVDQGAPQVLRQRPSSYLARLVRDDA